MKILTLSLLSLAALAVNPSQARDASFVSAEQTRALQILPAPPTANSELGRSELAELHRLEASRTPEQSQRAMADDKEETIFLFRKEMGPQFTAPLLPLTAAFSARVRNDEGVNTTPGKEGFARVRPYNQDPTLHPICVTKTKNDSYPSGHPKSGSYLVMARRSALCYGGKGRMIFATT